MTWEYVMFFLPSDQNPNKKKTKFVDEFRIFNKKKYKTAEKKYSYFL